MPVVELSYGRLERLVGAGRKKIIDAIPYLGLDIEGRTTEKIRVEYSPNRPDYSTDYGIALGLQGLLGVKKGMVRLDVRKAGYLIRADPSVSRIRPFVTGVVAKNGKIDGPALEQLLAMQEDLHLGIGRRRKKSSIGIHDLDKVSFPLRYTTAGRGHRFVPLYSKKALSVGEILKETDVGREYGGLLGGSGPVPVILDSKDCTVSLPPIINSAGTAVTTRTRDLFVEVTGTGRGEIENALSVIATILQSAGFKLHTVGVSGAGNAPPRLGPRKMAVDPQLVRSTLGLDLSANQVSAALKKCRLDAVVRGKKVWCTIPRYRFDIFGAQDLIEEIALGYGIQNMQPVLSPPRTLGQKSPFSSDMELVSSVMTGLGYAEALNSSLTSRRVLYDMLRDPSGMLSVANSKSREHALLRDSLLPGLINSLARNIHEPHPQRIFETGTVFGGAGRLAEQARLCALCSHRDASYTEIKSVLQSALHLMCAKTCRTVAVTDPSFEEGRAASVVLGRSTVGIVGEIAASVRQNFKLREPVVAFEVKVPENIA